MVNAGLGIFFRLSHTIGMVHALVVAPSAGYWAFSKPPNKLGTFLCTRTGVGACASGPLLSGQLHALSPGPALPPYKGRGAAGFRPPPLVHRPPAKANSQARNTFFALTSCTLG